MMSSEYVDTEIQIRYADIDSLNHVNNAIFLSYLELGRIDFLRKKAGEDFFSRNSIVMARIEIDYVSTIFIQDRLVCRTWIEKVGRTSIVFGNTLIKNGETVCANVRSTAVLVNYSGEKEEVPDRIRKLVS